MPRLPGRAATPHLHAHHIVHWAHGGETALDNLVHSCSHHHRLVHEGGFNVSGLIDVALPFTEHDGEPLVETPPRVRVEPGRELPRPAVFPQTRDGTRMDLAMAVEGILCASGLADNARSALAVRPRRGSDPRPSPRS